MQLVADHHNATRTLRLLADALDEVERTGVWWIEAELHRIRGELRLALPEPDLSEAEDLLPPNLR